MIWFFVKWYGILFKNKWFGFLSLLVDFEENLIVVKLRLGLGWFGLRVVVRDGL